MKGKKIILGVTGSIAAYKSAFLVRLLVKEGAEVKVVMTNAACDFITPVTLSTLSKNPVGIEFANKDNGEWADHVDLGRWADLLIVAPATANTIAKFANGICDNLLTAVYLSANCPVFIAPAMDVDMYNHQSTKDNLSKLRSYRNMIIEPEHGELASGLIGEGRMVEPEKIVEILSSDQNKLSNLNNKKVLVTAGPTYEPIDPVRFIGNRSSGKMGYAIAEEMARQGAEVTLISGPSDQRVQNRNIKLVEVETAEEMYEAAISYFPQTDITVMSAAVSDFTPATVESGKIKKNGSDLNLKLVKTKDILDKMGSLKSTSQILVGFALETDNDLENAMGKLNSKNLDLMVLNSLQDEGAGFGGDTNKITLIERNNKPEVFELKSKQDVAIDLVSKIITLIEN
ncbi:bifunctional phosphopantothenoylcysteine decarboxylase/phosphopantothenate--cysteine ligase CoaBC [bacterium AH-315-C07]|nr:bifunctional phosphopantothenoylcysteine decarboxylase/phosphopantothenate--cysteine ligase CoaBC [bacterium AH-315-C07]